MSKFKYIILSPRGNYGGTIALHALCKYLSELGQNSKMFYVSRFHYKTNNHIGYWLYYFLIFLIKDTIFSLLYRILGEKRFKLFHPNSIKGCKRKILPFFDKKTIVVYPEIVFGNPLGAKNVVRWLLYYYGNHYINADESWGENFRENDLVFCYRKIFNEKNLNPEERTVCTPYFDLDLYKQTYFGERKGNCYILRKGLGRNDLPSSFDGIVVDDLPEREKVRVFNECEYCISYDTQTAYSALASICGCISVVVPEEGKTREDYRPNGEIGYGVAFGFSEEEIQFAMSTRKKLIEYYKSLNQEGVNQTQYFIDECEKYFNI